MIAHLEQERAAFDGIARMMTEDRIDGMLRADRLPGSSPALRDRRERYRVLLARTRCRAVIRDGETGRITFEYPFAMRGGGVAGAGWKDFVYAPTPPSPLRKTVDILDGPRFEEVFRHVDGAWYLSASRS